MRDNMKSKGKSAYDHLRDIEVETHEIVELLGNAKKLLIEVIEKESKDIGGEIDNGKAQIIGSKIIGIPPRLRFTSCNIEFHIDFTVVPSGHGDEIISKGSIVYGTRRERYGAGQNVPEDRAFVEFFVNKHGMIQSNGGIEGEWWIGKEYKEEGDIKDEKEKETRDKQLDQVAELHFRALNHIWKDAVTWTNETLLP